MQAPCPSPDQALGQAGDVSADVASRLLAIGLSAEPLTEAVRAGYEAASRCTANDVVARVGWELWATPMRHVGDEYVSRGWSRERCEGLEILLNADKSVAVTVATGDDATGQDDRMPSTRLDRGPVTGQAIAGNRHQLRFDPSVSPFFLPNAELGTKTYLLIHHYDEEAEEIRLELSMPVEFDQSHHPGGKRGRVTHFEPRHILPAIPLVPFPEDDSPDESFEIPVEPRR